MEYANKPTIVFVADRNDPEYHRLGLVHETHGVNWQDAGCTALFSSAKGSYYRVYSDAQVTYIFPDDTRYADLEYMMLNSMP